MYSISGRNSSTIYACKIQIITSGKQTLWGAGELAVYFGIWISIIFSYLTQPSGHVVPHLLRQLRGLHGAKYIRNCK